MTWSLLRNISELHEELLTALDILGPYLIPYEVHDEDGVPKFDPAFEAEYQEGLSQTCQYTPLDTQLGCRERRHGGAAAFHQTERLKFLIQIRNLCVRGTNVRLLCDGCVPSLPLEVEHKASSAFLVDFRRRVRELANLGMVFQCD